MCRFVVGGRVSETDKKILATQTKKNYKTVMPFLAKSLFRQLNIKKVAKKNAKNSSMERMKIFRAYAIDYFVAL
jgi:hypothetical protein